jgi:hypothetical protein
MASQARVLALSLDAHRRMISCCARSSWGHVPGKVDIKSTERAYFIDFRQYFATELHQLKPLVESVLVQLESGSVRVTALG